MVFLTKCWHKCAFIYFVASKVMSFTDCVKMNSWHSVVRHQFNVTYSQWTVIIMMQSFLLIITSERPPTHKSALLPTRAKTVSNDKKSKLLFTLNKTCHQLPETMATTRNTVCLQGGTSLWQMHPRKSKID